MATMTYKDQLRHPFWQRKRLEVLQRAHFMCERCYDEETTLNVHHKRYVKGRMAWEYELIELEAVCEECHRLEHEGPDLLSDVVIRVPYEFRDDAAALLIGWNFSGATEDVAGRVNNKEAMLIGNIARSLFFSFNDVFLRELLEELDRLRAEVAAARIANGENQFKGIVMSPEKCLVISLRDKEEQG